MAFFSIHLEPSVVLWGQVIYLRKRRCFESMINNIPAFLTSPCLIYRISILLLEMFDRMSGMHKSIKHPGKCPGPKPRAT